MPLSISGVGAGKLPTKKNIKAIKLKDIKFNCWKDLGVHLLLPSTQGKTRTSHMRAKPPLGRMAPEMSVGGW